MKCQLCGAVVHYNRRKLSVTLGDGQKETLRVCNECFKKAGEYVASKLAVKDIPVKQPQTFTEIAEDLEIENIEVHPK